MKKALEFLGLRKSTKKIHDEFILAACHGRIIALDSLIKRYNIKIDAQDEYGFTALMIASAKGHIRCVKYLLAHNAGLDYQNIWGRTAVMEGIYSGHMDIISLLVKSGADTTLKDKDGKTIKDYTRQYRLEERLGEICNCSYCEDLEKERKVQQKLDEEKDKEKKKLISDLIYERKTKLISELTCDEILIWLENIKMPAMFIAIFKNNNISGEEIDRCDSESYLSDNYDIITLPQSKTFFKSIEVLREKSNRTASRIPLKLIQHT